MAAEQRKLLEQLMGGMFHRMTPGPLAQAAIGFNPRT